MRAAVEQDRLTGVAVVIGFGLAIVALYQVVGGERFYFWFGFALAAFGTVALTPWGRRLH